MSASGTLTFSASDTTQTISVTTLDDTIREEDESFSVILSAPAGATLADGTATGTITDDDDTALPALSIADAEPVTEGGTAQFEVTLSAESQQVVTVSYATADGTAVEDTDYTAARGTLSFQPGERAKTIPVTTLDDDAREEAEQFTVTLSGPGGATLGRSTGTGTIDDNDAPGTIPQLSIGDAAAVEGDAVEFTVTLTGTTNQDVTVDFQTADGTARAGSDYDQRSGTLTFTPGDRTRTISVPTIEDDIREEDETFLVTLTNPGGATLADDTATGDHHRRRRHRAAGAVHRRRRTGDRRGYRAVRGDAERRQPAGRHRRLRHGRRHRGRERRLHRGDRHPQLPAGREDQDHPGDHPRRRRAGIGRALHRLPRQPRRRHARRQFRARRHHRQ